MVSNCYSFQQLNDAVTNCTAFFIRKGKDADGDVTYQLVDGCGDDYEDPFYELIDVQHYITEDQDCFDYLYRFN